MPKGFQQIMLGIGLKGFLTTNQLEMSDIGNHCMSTLNLNSLENSWSPGFAWDGEIITTSENTKLKVQQVVEDATNSTGNCHPTFFFESHLFGDDGKALCKSHLQVVHHDLLAFG